GIDPYGANAACGGRSSLAGERLVALVLGRNAAVRLAHSRTRDLAGVTRRADLLVAAVGQPGLIRPDMVKPGAAVFDVGLTRVDSVVVGDVDPAVGEVPGWLPRIPGRPGLMAVTCVSDNTVTAAKRRRWAA